MNIDLPELSLIMLIGISGSGKSTFAREHFAPTEVLSSDFFRGLVADDENDQSATKDAFDALGHIAGIRLRAGRRVVIDATNVQQHARAELVALARSFDVLPVAIVIDTPEALAWERTQSRTDRDFGRNVLKRQGQDLRRSLRHLGREGFRKVHVVADPTDVTITYEKAWNDRRELTGPFDIIGDVHGCRAELETLLGELGWTLVRDEMGRPVDATHPDGRQAVFVGDLVDRGPDSPGVLRLVMGMTAQGNALCVPGNHEQKLLKKLRGKDVTLSHGLAETLEQLDSETPEFVAAAAQWIFDLVSHLRLDGGRLVVAHAGLKEAYHGRASGRVRDFCLYGESTGETDEYGLPVRYPWARDYRGAATVVYGHVPTPKVEWINNTVCLDTGAVFGGELTAMRYPEKSFVAVQAAQVYYQPIKPLAAEPARDDETLDLAEVTGRRHIRTDYGTVIVDAENSAAALEVMSRFAIDPRLLLWLPPTMSAPSTSTVEGYLEYPTEAFADYRAAGVDKVVCEEKHMGSRAVVLVCRDRAAARFGVDDGSSGAIYTRTGRSFFNDSTLTEALLARVRAAAAPLFDELASDWLLLDCELLPWSAKAAGLIRTQYAAAGAAARSALPTAVAALDAGLARGLDLGALRERTAARAENAAAFTTAYRAYCWPTTGLDGVRIAPFALLASEGAAYADRDHTWHLAISDRLVAADPETFHPTDRRIVDLSDPAAEAEATAWWLEMTASGGEGMVIKPHAGLAHRAKGKLAQPGIKCRGREYLRIIYGPDYTDPAHLTRLRERTLSRKRTLALREHLLGLAALDAVATAQPLWRVHELVFAILAMESVPTDPRL